MKATSRPFGTEPRHSHGQYMMVARPLAEIRAIIDRKDRVSAKSKNNLKDAIIAALYAEKLDKIEGSYKAGWNAAIEIAMQIVARTRV